MMSDAASIIYAAASSSGGGPLKPEEAPGELAVKPEALRFALSEDVGPTTGSDVRSRSCPIALLPFTFSFTNEAGLLELLHLIRNALFNTSDTSACGTHDALHVDDVSSFRCDSCIKKRFPISAFSFQKLPKPSREGKQQKQVRV